MASFVSTSAQSYLGLRMIIMQEFRRVLFNPSIVDALKPINLFSISIGNNDAYGVSIADAFKTGFDFDTQKKNHSAQITTLF
jgi:hypothetical protein